MATTTLQFEDVNEYKVNQFFLVPNEGTTSWRELVKSLRIDRAAAICSSGEVGLIALLPTVRKELVLIDHSYASLSVAMLKFLMLRELGPKETHRLLTSVNGVKDLQDKINQLLPTLPKVVREAYSTYVAEAKYGGGFVDGERDRGGYDGRGYYRDPKPGIIPGTEKLTTSVIREWDRLPKRAVWRCATKLDKVKFVHGDLHDLVERGPFDLLYLSNALEHGGRNGAPKFRVIAEAVKHGGYVIVAHRRDSYYNNTVKQLDDCGFKLVRDSESGPQAPMAWTQSLYQRPVKEAA